MQNYFSSLKTQFEGAQTVDLKSFDCPRTAVVVVDMINGFCKQGNLSDTRILQIVPKVQKMLSSLPNARKVFLRDEHTAKSLEFLSFPLHCIGDDESKVIDELLPFVDIDIAKNSTNGFFNFAKMVDLEDFDSFIICGDCTDICVLQFALSLKSYCNEYNLDKKLFVPVDGVATFDSPSHPAEFMNIFALKVLQDSGITLFCIER